jgi:hypothetical protein
MAKTEVRSAQIKDEDVATADIANGAVTLAKMANMATSSLIYRKTAGTGVPEVNTLATLKTDLGWPSPSFDSMTIAIDHASKGKINWTTGAVLQVQDTALDADQREALFKVWDPNSTGYNASLSLSVREGASSIATIAVNDTAVLSVSHYNSLSTINLACNILYGPAPRYSYWGDLSSGWMSLNISTYAYVSATQFTINGDVSTVFEPGTRITMYQGSRKYFACFGSSYNSGTDKTTVTISGGQDYTHTNSVPTSFGFSHQLSPQGYPDWFTYINNSNSTWGWTCSTGNAPAIGSGFIAFKFRVEGKTCWITGYLSGTGTGTPTTYGNGGNWNFQLPVASVNETAGNWLGAAHLRCNTQSWFRCMQIAPNASIIQYFFDPVGGTNNNFITYQSPARMDLYHGNLQFQLFYRYVA